MNQVTFPRIRKKEARGGSAKPCPAEKLRLGGGKNLQTPPVLPHIRKKKKKQREEEIDCQHSAHFGVGEKREKKRGVLEPPRVLQSQERT